MQIICTVQYSVHYTTHRRVYLYLRKHHGQFSICGLLAQQLTNWSHISTPSWCSCWGDALKSSRSTLQIGWRWNLAGLFIDWWSPICRDSIKSCQKWHKNTAKFCVNRKNHGKITSPKTHSKTQHFTSSIDDHHYMQCKVFICKILSLQSIN